MADAKPKTAEGKPKAAPAGEPALELDLPARPASGSGGPRSGETRTPEPGSSGRMGPISRELRIPGPGGRRPQTLEGFAGTAARALGVAASALVRLSRFGFSKAKQHGGKALHDFAQRPEHARWRAFAFGGYLFLAVATFAAQLWEPNSLNAYVKVRPVALPESTVIFVRNDSKKTWKDVKVILNGQWGYERNELQPLAQFQLPVNRFLIADPTGKVTFAPKDLILKTLTIDCDRGHFEQEFEK